MTQASPRPKQTRVEIWIDAGRAAVAARHSERSWAATLSSQQQDAEAARLFLPASHSAGGASGGPAVVFRCRRRQGRPGLG